MEEEQRQANVSLSKFAEAVDELQKTLRPALSAVDALRASSNEGDLDAMSRARLHISLCYAVNTLFCMYLRTQGVDPSTHPVADELARIQEAFMRMRRVEAGLSVDHRRAPDRDRRRHIVNAKKAASKLGGLVFPEEAELVNALKQQKSKRKWEEDEDEGNVKKDVNMVRSESEDNDSEDESQPKKENLNSEQKQGNGTSSIARQSDSESDVGDSEDEKEVRNKKLKKDRKKAKKEKMGKKEKTAKKERENAEEGGTAEKRERKRRKKEEKRRKSS